MKWSTILRRLSYYAQYIPFTRYTLLIGLLCWIFLPALFDEKSEIVGTSAIQPFVSLMTKIAMIVLITLMVISVLSTIFVWLLYNYRKKKGIAQLHLDFEPTTEKESASIRVKVWLQKAFKPLLGYVMVRLIYDRQFMSKSIALFSRKKSDTALLLPQPYGQTIVHLKDIRKYRVLEHWIFFQDMLRIISLPVMEMNTQEFLVHPKGIDTNERKVLPSRTENTEIRINEMRRTEGEMTHYKDYEAGDDIRRINWKVYARNKNLVVRIPERFEPYASHLYVFQSFHMGIPGLDSTNEFVIALLNEYKEQSWTLIQQMLQQFPNIRYVNDQPQASISLPEKALAIQQAIACASWQSNNALHELLSPQKSSALIIHSLNNADDVAHTLGQLQKNVPVFFIPLSRLFYKKAWQSQLENILLLPPEDHLQQLKNRWWRSSVKNSILKNEKKLVEMMDRIEHAVSL